MIINVIKRTGVLALGTGVFAYIYHARRHYQNLYCVLAQEDEEQRHTYCLPDLDPKNRASVPPPCARKGPLFLELKQVQVMFRHGARTPIHTIPKVEEVAYDPQFVTREHEASNFPYLRVSHTDGQPKDYSEYEKRLQMRTLRGGAYAGELSSYGKDQMYMLGRRLKDCYVDRLCLGIYSPQQVFILSTNIRRTIESARCVLAGLYGKEQLTDFADHSQPVEILLCDDKYNILIPDSRQCPVLEKVNHSAMLHPDFISGMKDERLRVENDVYVPYDDLLDRVEVVQKKIESNLQGVEGRKPRPQDFNQNRQPYVKDAIKDPLFQERARAIEKIDRFWSRVMIRHPELSQVLTKEDMRALIYLRRLEVEEFEGKFQSGYRFHFVFDRNPYFYNQHIVKEIYSQPSTKPSSSTVIKWKDCDSLFLEQGGRCHRESEESKEDGEEQMAEEGTSDQEKKVWSERKKDGPSNYQSCCDRMAVTVGTREEGATESNASLPVSFLSWFIQPTTSDEDWLGTILKDLWLKPLDHLQNEPKWRDPWDHIFHFVFARDDVIARITHGYPIPKCLKGYKNLVKKNATKILYYAMTGQHDAERMVITRLSAGRLVLDMVNKAESVIAGRRPTHKLCLYSSHDSTMAALMEVFDIWEDKWPPFGADIRLELYKEVDSNEYYVRLLYCGKEKKFRDQNEYFVHWCDFKKAIKPYMIRQEEFTAICSSNILEKIAQDLLQHEEAEVSTSESKEESETPAGM